MAPKLTDRAVETINPGLARQEIPDGQISGLYLVVQTSGAKSWAFRFRVKGQSRKLTLGSFPALTLEAARDLAQGAAVEVGRGNDPAAERQAIKAAAPIVVNDRIEDVVTLFIENYAKRHTRETSWREAERLLKRHVLPVWGGRRLSEIDRLDVHKLLDDIVDRTPVLANRLLAVIRKMSGWAVERDLIDKNPCDRVKRPAAEKSRDRVLNDDELRRLLIAAETLGFPFGPLFKVIALTGQRRDEVGRLKWSEIDLEQRLWTLPAERAKNGKRHTIPLSEPVMKILEVLPRIGPDVFTTSGKAPVASFHKAKERLNAAIGPGMAPFVLHDLRRSMISGMARLGVALPTIAKVVNRTSGSFGGIAAVCQHHSCADEKRAALDLWAANVERLTAAPTNMTTPVAEHP